VTLGTETTPTKEEMRGPTTEVEVPTESLFRPGEAPKLEEMTSTPIDPPDPSRDPPSDQLKGLLNDPPRGPPNDRSTGPFTPRDPSTRPKDRPDRCLQAQLRARREVAPRPRQLLTKDLSPALSSECVIFTK